MNEISSPAKTYINPVYNQPCPDPFILKYRNEYWCYCTGIWKDGRVFGILHSRDLIEWHEVGSAMERWDTEATCYWAPEVTYDNGRFLLYYSVGNEETMHIRVAIAEHPAGPFVDSGKVLTSEPFAIDPHIFLDDDGSRHLFYATDFLEHTHIGTGTVCDRMLDWFTLEGKPRPVTRARYDWQVYDPQRAEKGGVRWHTVEGPFVLKRKGKYYEMFSGGNWKNQTYGVSYAITESLETSDEWQQAADGDTILPILRTIPEKVLGPGHNSVVRGTNNLELFCIYHRWSADNNDRVLSIDRLDWAGDRMLILGPTTEVQPAPWRPGFTDFFDQQIDAGLGERWQCVGGEWRVTNGEAVQQSNAGVTTARPLVEDRRFIVEVSLRSLNNEGKAFGIKLMGGEQDALYFKLLPQQNRAAIAWQLPDQSDGSWIEEEFALPPDFKMDAYHLLRVEVDESLVKIRLDDCAVVWHGSASIAPHQVRLWTDSAAAAFSGFALTRGWQDLFAEQFTDLKQLGWQTKPNEESWIIKDRQLWYQNFHMLDSIIAKSVLPNSYEMVINAKLCSEAAAGCGYGFLPALNTSGVNVLFTVEKTDKGWAMMYDEPAMTHIFALPENFDPSVYQQFRFRKEQNQLTIQHEAQTLGTVEVPQATTHVGLYAYKVVAAFDMVRVTALDE